MNRFVLISFILLCPVLFGQDGPKRIGFIEFFGAQGIDTEKLKAQLPLREGGDFDEKAAEEKIAKTAESIEMMTHRPPTDISVTCCDAQGNWTIYLGLSGKSVSYQPTPNGATKLPQTLLDLYGRIVDAIADAVKRGAATEDQSKGYALSADPALRSLQLDLKKYADQHEPLIREALKSSSQDLHRIVAAMALGYAPQSKLQISALVAASRDSNSQVRNNATRALMVLTESNPKLAANVSADTFIEMILSGKWTDLNKSSMLLMNLSKSRNRDLMARLQKKEVRERLIEIAKWRTGHAAPARYILGRLSGIKETRLQKLVEAGDMKAIMSAGDRQ